MPSGTLRVGILAGEVSGDILGSHLLAALKSRFENVIVEGIGGPLMAAQGLTSMFPMDRLSVMGFVEPLKRLPELLRIRRTVYQHFLANPPDVFIGIDSPDFNLRLEYKLRTAGIITVHLVSPSVWAWRGGRIHKIKRSIDLMLTLFPFEVDIYRTHGVPVEFVGHPLADEIPLQLDTAEAKDRLGYYPTGKCLALMPGSRAGEVKMLTPLFLNTARLLMARIPDISFIMPAANEARYVELQQHLQANPDLPVTLIQGQSRDAMAASDAVLLASGTATLEALLLKRPMVIAYKMAALSWAIISRIVTTKYAGLPNVLADRELVPELLQGQARADLVAAALLPLLTDGTDRDSTIAEFDRIHRQLRLGYGDCSAAAIVEKLAE
ncbi:MAG: lipid-A-disaccharide synthase [Halioglobus sp.]|jgi:lipid-A-disaccharide synthase